MGAGQNAKHQPVMIHPSISPARPPARPSRLSSLAGDGQHAADRPAERQGEEEEEEGLLPSSLFALPPPSPSPTHSLPRSLSWSPCGDLARLSARPPAVFASLRFELCYLGMCGWCAPASGADGRSDGRTRRSVGRRVCGRLLTRERSDDDLWCLESTPLHWSEEEEAASATQRSYLGCISN